MNILDKYSAIHNYGLDVKPVKVFKPAETDKMEILSDMKTITIAEIHPASKPFLTAHRLKDYRRKTFSLLLLPDIELPLDKLMEELPPLEQFDEFRPTHLK